jgi:hypothetical protein
LGTNERRKGAAPRHSLVQQKICKARDRLMKWVQGGIETRKRAASVVGLAGEDCHRSGGRAKKYSRRQLDFQDLLLRRRVGALID